MDKAYRFGSYLLIAGGVTCISLLIFGDHGKLILEDAPNLVTKYLVIILLFNGAIAFPFFGYMFLKGKLTPWYSQNISDVEKARLYVYAAIATLPFYLSVIFMIITNDVSRFLLVAVTLMLFWFVYCVIKSVVILSRNH